MSHPLQTVIKLDIGGAERKLSFDFNAICKVSELTGINLIQACVSNVEPSNIRALLYASLIHDDPELTIEQVGSWITLKNLVHIRTAINAAWFESLLDEQPTETSSEGEDEAQS